MPNGRGEAAGRTDDAALAEPDTTGTSAPKPVDDRQMLLAAVLANLPLGVGIYDEGGDLLHSNERMRDYVGVKRLPSRVPDASRRWRGFSPDGRQILPEDYPGARALRGEAVTPGIDFLYEGNGEEERWVRVSSAPLSAAHDRRQAIVVVQDVDDLKRAAERLESARFELASQSRFLDATLSSIPDFVYAFDPQHRFVYANRAMLALFGLSASEMHGLTFADLGYPTQLAEQLSRDIDRVLANGTVVEDEVFYRSPIGYSAFFSYLWGPVWSDHGSVELVVGVSRDTTERRAVEEALRVGEARLRAATELVGLGIYSWDPVTGALDWDERLRAMWGLPADAKVDMGVYEAGIHPDDLQRVRDAIAACVDPTGDGRYNIEYRVIGRDDGITRTIATSGRTSFRDGKPVGFIGAAIDVSPQRQAEAAIRASEAQFQSFAEHSSNLIWIVDVAAGAIVYRSAAFERIWGVSAAAAPTLFAEWITNVHPDDRAQIEHALATVKRGEVAHYQYRIIRPADGAIRSLRDIAFPIPDQDGVVTRIGGITEDLTEDDVNQVYIVSASAVEARRLSRLVRDLGHRARTFDSIPTFLDIAAVLAPGCVLLDLRKRRQEGLLVPRELKARSIHLPVIALDASGTDAEAAVAAMKAGAIDFVVTKDESSLREKLAAAIAECSPSAPPSNRDESAAARVARLTPRERDVLVGLVEGGTNKIMGQKLGISPRTVELHRAQVMSRLSAGSLTELLQIALAAGLTPMKARCRG